MNAGLSVSLSQDRPIPLAAFFDCAPGEMLALVGPSGSGKSTILRTIAGLYTPRDGHVAVNGAVWLDTKSGRALAPHRRQAGLVFQNYALFPHMSALDNVAAALDHRPPAEGRARAQELLGLVHLGGLEARKPAELSGGQQQRVAVARALARDPAVLLLDEPFSAVDRATRQRLYLELAELRLELRMPVVLVTHDLDEAVMLADRICVLHRGRTLQSGSPDDVTMRPVSADVARLIGLRNIFRAVVIALDAARNRMLIDWGGQRLECALQPGFEVGQRASWVIPDGFVVLHRRDRPSRGEHENPVEGVVEASLAVGQTAHIVLRARHAEAQPLFFSVPLHVARRNGIAVGVTATVSLLAEGIHLMPLEEPRAA